LTAAALIVLGLTSCASTQVVSQWQDKEFKGKVHKVLVIGMANQETTRRIYEETISADLKQKGVTTVAASSVWVTKNDITRDAVIAYLKGKDFDGVIVTRLVDVQRSQTYVPPTYYNSFNDYYYRTYPTTVSSGYLVDSTVVSLETNVYSLGASKAGQAGKDGLIWSVVSETFNPVDIEKEIKSLSTLLVSKMAKDGVI
jgi:hypothetical protein